MNEFDRVYVKAGVVRWQSNDRVPFDDMLAKFIVEGRITNREAEKSAEARKVEDAKFFENYRKNYKGPSEEERLEMRAAFGEGAEVVNVITGKTIKV